MVDVFTTKPLRDLDTLSDQKVIFDLLFFKIVTCAFLVIDKNLGCEESSYKRDREERTHCLVSIARALYLFANNA